MNPDHQNEVWQVEVGGQVYEAPLSELPEWIEEGSLQPCDKVRKGNLRWIEAQKIPSLIPFFNAKANGVAVPLVQSVTNAAAAIVTEPEEPIAETRTSRNLSPVVSDPALSGAAIRTAVPESMPGRCARHSDRDAAFVCTVCGLELCKACPSSYGGSVRICPDCGSLCRSLADAAKESGKAAIRSGIGSEAFGFADLGRAFAYPFRFKTSLLLGGLMFVFFSFGQSAASVGGLFLIGASIVCFMMANMMVFGVRANVIDNFVQGKLDLDFMPSFEDFSAWDDVIHPFFLYIGAMISSFGPFLLVFAVGAYMIFSSATEQMQKYNEQLTRVPGTQFYAPDRTAQQSKEVSELLSKVKQQNERRVADQQRAVEAAETGDTPAASSDPATQEQDLDQLLQEIRSKQQQTIVTAGQEENKRDQYAAIAASVLKLAAPLVIFGFITLLWALFYYPAACAVAGYTRSFTATVNPLVGLDTIRRLGASYFLILVMCFVIVLIAGGIMVILQTILSPFDLPRVGNLPASVIGGFVSFYFSVVFSCILGYALFKSADKLKLSR